MSDVTQSTDRSMICSAIISALSVSANKQHVSVRIQNVEPAIANVFPRDTSVKKSADV
jgi:hypothetical protein